MNNINRAKYDDADQNISQDTESIISASQKISNANHLNDQASKSSTKSPKKPIDIRGI